MFNVISGVRMICADRCIESLVRWLLPFKFAQLPIIPSPPQLYISRQAHKASPPSLFIPRLEHRPPLTSVTATSPSQYDNESTNQENIYTPDSRTMSNSPAPEPNTETHSYNPNIGSRHYNSSWFEIELRFCNAETWNNISDTPHNHASDAVHRDTAILFVDRREYIAICVRRLQQLITESASCQNLTNKLHYHPFGFAVGRSGKSCPGVSEKLGVRVTLDALVAHMYETETEGLAGVKPDFFGLGSNEVQVLHN